MILVYIPCKDGQESRSIARTLLERRLIACANIFPVTSVYRWDDTLDENSESVLLCKTLTDLYDELSRVVRDIHSYETPAIIKMEADANKGFSDWLGKEVNS